MGNWRVIMLIRIRKFNASLCSSKKVICVQTFLCATILCISACSHHVHEMKHHESANNIFYISDDEAFGYPQKRFLHPLVSPDDRWVAFHSIHEIDWSEAKFEDFIFQNVPDTMWKKIYYSEVGKYDKKIIPYPQTPKGSRIKLVDGEKWSPDGRYFVYHTEIEHKSGRSEDRIVVVDFGFSHPIFVESIECTSYPDFYFIDNDSFVFVDITGQWLLKKRIGSSPQKTIQFEKRTVNFQISSNGNVVYRCGRDELYLDNFIVPSSSTRRLAAHHSYTLSPDGRYVVFYTNKFYTKIKGRKNDELSVLVDLEKRKIIYTFIIERYRSVNWSPDGRKIVFVGEDIDQFEKQNVPMGNDYHHLVVLDIEAMDIRIYNEYQPDPIIWFPDCKRIIYPQGSRFIVRNTETNAIEGIINNVREQGIWLTPSGKTIYWESCLDIGEQCFFIIHNPFHFTD